MSRFRRTIGAWSLSNSWPPSHRASIRPTAPAGEAALPVAAALKVVGATLGAVFLDAQMDPDFSIEGGCLLFAAYATIGSGLMGTALGFRSRRTPAHTGSARL